METEEKDFVNSGQQMEDVPTDPRIQQLEILLQDKTRQLEELTQELDDLSFAISHDMKAPLRAIQGFSAILKEEQYEILNEEGRRVVDVISANSEKLTAMINDMVSNSAISKNQLTNQAVSMRQLALDSLDAILSKEEKAIFDIHVQELHNCICDGKMMKHVWINLLNFALLHAESNEYSGINIASLDEPGSFTYIIKTFKAFSIKTGNQRNLMRQQSRRHAKIEGHGTGLAFVKRVLFKHSGNFWTQIEPGISGNFFFSLPKL